jgi:hypothetical protein
MSYLSCPYCPSQAYPQETEPAIKLGMGLQLFRCISKHEFYVKEEREKQIEPEPDVYVCTNVQ